MAKWHLDELRAMLEQRGWRIAELPGDDYGVSATWRLQRGVDGPEVLVDFDGFDDMQVLPVARSFACRVRGALPALYLGRRGDPSSRVRTRWRMELAAFVDAIENLDRNDEHWRY